MCTITVKTLDSQNHKFDEIDDTIAVEDFKALISEKVGIAADLQRLIYGGRVLNDETPICEYALDGMVVHLAQRPPTVSQPSRLPNIIPRSPSRGASPSVRHPIAHFHVHTEPHRPAGGISAFVAPSGGVIGQSSPAVQLTLTQDMMRQTNRVQDRLDGREPPGAESEILPLENQSPDAGKNILAAENEMLNAENKRLKSKIDKNEEIMENLSEKNKKLQEENEIFKKIIYKDYIELCKLKQNYKDEQEKMVNNHATNIKQLHAVNDILRSEIQKKENCMKRVSVEKEMYEEINKIINKMLFVEITILKSEMDKKEENIENLTTKNKNLGKANELLNEKMVKNLVIERKSEEDNRKKCSNILLLKEKVKRTTETRQEIASFGQPLSNLDSDSAQVTRDSFNKLQKGKLDTDTDTLSGSLKRNQEASERLPSLVSEEDNCMDELDELQDNGDTVEQELQQQIPYQQHQNCIDVDEAVYLEEGTVEREVEDFSLEINLLKIPKKQQNASSQAISDLCGISTEIDETVDKEMAATNVYLDMDLVETLALSSTFIVTDSVEFEEVNDAMKAVEDKVMAAQNAFAVSQSEAMDEVKEAVALQDNAIEEVAVNEDPTFIRDSEIQCKIVDIQVEKKTAEKPSTNTKQSEAESKHSSIERKEPEEMVENLVFERKGEEYKRILNYREQETASSFCQPLISNLDSADDNCIDEVDDPNEYLEEDDGDTIEQELQHQTQDQQQQDSINVDEVVDLEVGAVVRRAEEWSSETNLHTISEKPQNMSSQWDVSVEIEETVDNEMVATNVYLDMDLVETLALPSTFIVTAAMEAEKVIDAMEEVGDEVVAAHDAVSQKEASEEVEEAVALQDNMSGEVGTNEDPNSRTGLSLKFICDSEIQCEIIDIQRKKQQLKKPSTKRKQPEAETKQSLTKRKEDNRVVDYREQEIASLFCQPLLSNLDSDSQQLTSDSLHQLKKLKLDIVNDTLSGPDSEELQDLEINREVPERLPTIASEEDNCMGGLDDPKEDVEEDDEDTIEQEFQHQTQDQQQQEVVGLEEGAVKRWAEEFSSEKNLCKISEKQQNMSNQEMVATNVYLDKDLVGQNRNMHIDSVLPEADFSPACQLSSTCIVTDAIEVEKEIDAMQAVEDVAAHDASEVCRSDTMEEVEEAVVVQHNTTEEVATNEKPSSRTGLLLNFICDSEVQCKIVDIQRQKKQAKKPSTKSKQPKPEAKQSLTTRKDPEDLVKNLVDYREQEIASSFCQPLISNLEQLASDSLHQLKKRKLDIVKDTLSGFDSEDEQELERNREASKRLHKLASEEDNCMDELNDSKDDVEEDDGDNIEQELQSRDQQQQDSIDVDEAVGLVEEVVERGAEDFSSEPKISDQWGVSLISDKIVDKEIVATNVYLEMDLVETLALSSTFIVTDAVAVEEEIDAIVEDKVVAAHKEKVATNEDPSSRTGLSLNFICDSEVQWKIVDIERKQKQAKNPAIKRKQPEAEAKSSTKRKETNAMVKNLLVEMVQNIVVAVEDKVVAAHDAFQVCQIDAIGETVAMQDITVEEYPSLRTGLSLHFICDSEVQCHIVDFQRKQKQAKKPSTKRKQHEAEPAITKKRKVFHSPTRDQKEIMSLNMPLDVPTPTPTYSQENEMHPSKFVDCQICSHCKDNPNYGGVGKLKQSCKEKPKRIRANTTKRNEVATNKSDFHQSLNLSCAISQRLNLL